MADDPLRSPDQDQVDKESQNLAILTQLQPYALIAVIKFAKQYPSSDFTQILLGTGTGVQALIDDYEE